MSPIDRHRLVAKVLVGVIALFLARGMLRVDAPGRALPAARALKLKAVRPYRLPPTEMARLVYEVRQLRARRAAQARRPAPLSRAHAHTAAATLGAPGALGRKPGRRVVKKTKKPPVKRAARGR